MTSEELMRGIEKHVGLLNDPDLQFLRAAYAKIIEAFADELSKRRESDNPERKKGVKYS